MATGKGAALFDKTIYAAEDISDKAFIHLANGHINMI